MEIIPGRGWKPEGQRIEWDTDLLWANRTWQVPQSGAQHRDSQGYVGSREGWLAPVQGLLTGKLHCISPLEGHSTPLLAHPLGLTLSATSSEGSFLTILPELRLLLFPITEPSFLPLQDNFKLCIYICVYVFTLSPLTKLLTICTRVASCVLCQCVPSN